MTSLHTTANLLKYRPEVSPHPQHNKLIGLISAAVSAGRQARTGDLFASPEGVKLLLAAYDLFEVEGLHEMAKDVDAPFGTMES